MKWIPYTYQQHCIDHILNHEGAGLFLDMGLGKTVITLSAIDILMFDRVEVQKALVIAPLAVAQDVWTDERDKWDHLKHLRISRVIGSEAQRKKALLANADIYVINRENTDWLVAQYGTRFPFDMVVLDELSSFKNPSSQRFKAIRKVMPMVKRRVGLTGTPAANGLIDLWGEVFLLDYGKRLGETFPTFCQRYFFKNKYVAFGKYQLREGEPLLGKDIYEKEIFSKIQDICISMKKEDFLDMPELVERNIEITLSHEALKRYQEFEKEKVLELDDEEEITAINAAALRTKLMQFASGAVYDTEKIYHEVHSHKIDRLEEILDTLNGTPLLVAYAYQHDLHRIQRHLKKFNPVKLDTPEKRLAWNRGEISFAALHPASGGHGLNLQYGGHNVLWFGPTDNLEWYQQLNGRIYRQGQEFTTFINRFLAKGTIDAAVYASLDGKEDVQDALMKATRAIIDKWKPKRRRA
jgi:SNF2 family DNA or RNA helicase